MATITKGYSFGSSELVNNTKLHSLIDSASIASIVNSNLAPYILSSMATTAGRLPLRNMVYFSNLATNTTIPSIGDYTTLKLYHSTYCSIPSIAGAETGQKITFIAGQASTPSIVDTGIFLLSANWTPAKAGDNITLVWDGTSFIEISRVSV